MKNTAELSFKIISLGCKVNYYEKQAIASFLESKGMIEKLDNEAVDVAVINTCTVTEEASRKSRQMIRRTIRENPSEICIVMGCLAQIDSKIKDIKGVNIILGSSNKGLIYDAIEDYLVNHNNLDWVSKDIFHSEYDNFKVDKFEAHTRAFMKVEDGCTNFCTYCVIPYARGNIRSKPLNIALDEAKELVKNGHKEIIISGIHTGAYGRDLGITLYDLLKGLDEIDGLLRIRISSIEINQITDDIINLAKSSKKLVHHFHIPLQAGSDRILKLMNRHYTKDEFIDRVNYIRKEIPNVSITTDYIVGFPTETDEDFKESIETLNKIDFQTIHTFPYSLREGTKAASMEQVDSKVKKERSEIVLKMSKDGYNRYVDKNIGNILDVIFETYKDGYVFGHTGNFIYTKAKGSISDLNKLIFVKIIKNDGVVVLSEIVKGES